MSARIIIMKKVRISQQRASISTTIAVVIIIVIVAVAGIAAYYFLAPGSKSETNLTVGILPTADAVPFFVALHNGYFAQEGLNITVKYMAGGAVIAPAVQQGTIQLGEGTPITLMASREQGFDFKFVAPMSATVYPTGSQPTTYVPGVSTHLLGVLASSNITSYKDLVGKTVAVNTLGTFTQAAIIQALKDNGVDPSTVKIVAVSPPNWISSLEQKRVDAVDFFEPFATLLVTANQTAPTVGAFRIIGDDANIGNVMQAGFFSTSTWINSNPSTVKSFVKALDQGVSAAQANNTLARQMLTSYLNMSSTVANKVVLFNYPTSPMPYSLIQNEIQLGLQTGLLKNQSDNATQLVDTTYFQLTQ
ncbi:MAG: ABC transporter substrate-binding protein [Nitrososphaerota archaeon]|nr:ABC transporter substrate-binding protein [Nitrososphaerota archaeon]